jgi:plastocyanin
VIFFADVPAPADPRVMRAEIAQQDEQFVPHVVAITTGSRVEFPNRDLFFHNVFSLSRPATFDLGKFAAGATKSRTFPKPGIVKVYCHIHSQMSAVIRVFDHPWFTIPNDDGAFVIDRVPAGDFTLVAWHERIGERHEKVTIRAGATTDITFTLPVLEPGQ